MRKSFNTLSNRQFHLATEDHQVMNFGDNGVDVSDDLLFDDHKAQELPKEATDILVTISPETAVKISEGGADVALEHLWNMCGDIDSIRQSVHAAGGVNRSIAMECERIVPGFLTDDYPLKTFSQEPTRTNLVYTTEMFDARTATIIGAIIATCLALIKFLSGDGDSSGNGGGAAAKVEGNISKQIEEYKKIAAALEEGVRKGNQALAVTEIIANNHIDFKSKNDLTNSRIDKLNERVKQGLNGVQMMVLGLGDSKAKSTKFWEVMGKGNFSRAVLTMSGVVETLSKELENAKPGTDFKANPKILGDLKAQIQTMYGQIKPLALFKAVPVNPEEIVSQDQAADAFFSADPTKPWLDEFATLKEAQVTTGYAEVLTQTISGKLFTPSDIFFSDLEQMAADSEARKTANRDMGKNAIDHMNQLKDAFKVADTTPSSGEVSSSMPKEVRHAIRLIDFALRVIRNLYKIFDYITKALDIVLQHVKADCETILLVNTEKAEAAKT